MPLPLKQPDPIENRKVVVIGSGGHAGVTCVSWTDEQLPNIVDFDVCIVSVRSLTDEVLNTIKVGRFKEISKKLVRLLISSGTVIVVMENHKWITVSKKTYTSRTNYEWLPFAISFTTESGDTIEFPKSDFNTYLSKLKSWHFYHFCKLLDIEWQPYIGKDFKVTIPIQPIAQNREGRHLASTALVKFYAPTYVGYEGRTITHSEPPDRETGQIVFLPPIAELDGQESVNLILQDLGFVRTTSEPAWVQNIEVPGTSKLRAEIVQLTQSAGEIERSIARIEAEYEKLRRYRSLLYSSGAQLESIFRDSLILLGATVEEAKYAKEEYLLLWKDVECLVEVKGNSKSASLDNVRQILDYTIHFQKDTGREGKGVLFVNSWRLIPAVERDTTEKPTFPDDVRKTAAKHGIALVSSITYFEALCRFLRNEIKSDEILDRIVQTNGVVTF